MIHPTRTNLLILKDKALSTANSADILRARRQALIRELLDTSAPFLRSRDQVMAAYGHAIVELARCTAIEGECVIESIEAAAGVNRGIEIADRKVMGLAYKDVTVLESPRRPLDGRGYDYRGATDHLDEMLDLFETLLAALLEMAVYEARLKRLSAEILRLTRRVRVIEERIIPALHHQIRRIGQFLSEREREAAYRLRRFMKA